MYRQFIHSVAFPATPPAILNQKSIKECDKLNSHISRKLHKIKISYNFDSHPVTKIFTPLHYTSSNYTSLHFTTLVDTSLLPI